MALIVLTVFKAKYIQVELFSIYPIKYL